MFAIKCDECRGRVNQTLSAALPTVISGLDMPPWYFAIHCTESFTNLHFTYRPNFGIEMRFPTFWVFIHSQIWNTPSFFFLNNRHNKMVYPLLYGWSWLVTVLFMAFSDRDLLAKIGNEWMIVFKVARRWNKIDEKQLKRSNLAEGEGDEHIRWSAFHFHWKEKVRYVISF